MKIAVVHGVRHYRGAPSEAVPYYAERWKPILAAVPGLPQEALPFEVRPVYYAHLLVESGRQGDELAPDAQKLLATFLEPWHPDTTGAQGRATKPFRIALARLAEHYKLPEKQLTRFLERFFNEVAAFLRREGDFTPKSKVTGLVAEAIADVDVVIAHSLGSVVAYETLWAHRLDLPLLVTIGSPLAMPQAIHPRLTPNPVDGLGKKPPGVNQWSNLADEGDCIAIPPGGVIKSFTGVQEDVCGSIGAFAFHQLDKYLGSPALGEILARWHGQVR